MLRLIPLVGLLLVLPGCARKARSDGTRRDARGAERAASGPSSPRPSPPRPTRAAGPGADAAVTPPAAAPRPGYFGTVSAPVKGPLSRDRAEVTRWIRDRVSRAASGQPELVRVPVFSRGHRGCHGDHPGESPDVWIGVSDYEVEPTDGERDARQGPWVSLNLPPGLSLSSRDDASPTDWGDESVILEGWFTGKVISRDAYAGVSRKEFKVARDEGWYDLAVLEVVRMRPPRFVGEEHSAGDDHVWVMLDAPSRQIQVPRLADARPWLVAAASIPLHEPQALRQAEAVRDRVRKAGFPDVELLDSRQATRLFCCHLLVVAARTATRSEADALVHRAKKAGLVTYPVQGW